MIVIVDDRRRVVLPNGVNPGDAFSIEEIENGGFILRREQKSRRKVSLTRENGILVASSANTITMAQTRAMMDRLS